MTAGGPRSWWSRLAAVPWRRAVPAVLGLVLGLALLSLSLEMSSAGVSGFAETDFLLMEAESPFTTADLAARNLDVVGFSSLELPGGAIIDGKEMALSIREGRRGEDAVGGPTGISPFEIGAGSRVSLVVDREERRSTLLVEGEEIRLALIPPQGASVRLDGERCPPEACDFVYLDARPLYLTAGGDTPLEMYLDLEERPRTFTDRVAVSSLQLWELERLPGTVERRGAVHGGSLRFLEAPAQTEPLERGAVVDLEPAGLVLRAVELREEGVYLQLSGRVEGASIRIGDAGHSLMPTFFDWLSRHPLVQLALGALSILLGGGLALFQSLAQKATSGDADAGQTPAAGARAGGDSPEEPETST